MKIYLCGPITGQKNYKANFEMAESKLSKDGHLVYNPVKVEENFPNGSYKDYMEIDEILLRMCDAIYLLKGWQRSNGANQEYRYAQACGKIILTETDA